MGRIYWARNNISPLKETLLAPLFAIIMNLILRYFPHLSDKQQEQFAALYDLYSDWNTKINVISRKDIENLYLHHVLHSLTIAKLINFSAGTTVLDVGTGGGFPGIPLAILFPDVKFTLIDSIGKKIRVATEISEAIGLKNIELKHERIEEEKRQFDFVVSRAVMPFGDLLRHSKKNISKNHKNSLPNGIICLKGGDLKDEIFPFRKIIETHDISDFFDEDFFKTKKIIYLPV